MAGSDARGGAPWAAIPWGRDFASPHFEPLRWCGSPRAYVRRVQRNATHHHGNELICGDCRTHLPALDTGSVDLVVTDPPYGLASHTTIMRRAGKFGPAADIRASFEWD